MSDEKQLVRYDEGSVAFKDDGQLEGELAAKSDGSEEYKKGKQFRDEKNYAEALKWFKTAADLGYTDAMIVLGNMYKNGTGVEKSFEIARDYYSKASEKDGFSGEYSLGLLYQAWEGPEKSLSAALYHYTQSADQGHQLAAYYLGLMYQTGEGITINYAKAAYYQEKAIELGLKKPIMTLPMLYWSGGNGLEKNKEKSLYYANIALERSAQSTDETSSKLAEQYLSTLLILIAEDFKNVENYEEALKLCNKVLAFKNTQPQDKCFVFSMAGTIFYAARHIEKNFEQALHYFELGSNIAECKVSGRAESLAWLGRMHLIGRVVQKDTKKALELLDSAGKLGSKVAMYTLCGIYVNGYAENKDLEKAIHYCSQMNVYAGQDSALGHLYYYAKQYDKAFSYLKNVQDGSPDSKAAAHLISVMYLNGYAVEKSFDMAIEWSKKSEEWWEKGLVNIINSEERKSDKGSWEEVRTDATKFEKFHLGGLLGLSSEEEQSLFGQS